MQVNWESFETYNHDARGIQFKFEDLCRQLFINENITGNRHHRYPHANPNNPGLETEPVFDEERQLWIGFQAKYFDNKVDYDQIFHSAMETIEHYTGQDGIVNLVYIFSNKQISTTAKKFVEMRDLMLSHNIEIQLVTDTAILDRIRDKYPNLALYYFGNHTITPEWFAAHTQNMFDALGKRYDKDFYVPTKPMDELSIFVHDKEAANYFNAKKTDLLSRIDEFRGRNDETNNYLETLRSSVTSLPDVDDTTVYLATDWADTVKRAVNDYIAKFTEECRRLEEESGKLYSIVEDSSRMKTEQTEALKKYRALGTQISKIETLIELPESLIITEREKQLLCSKVLAISGRAGMGKSQMLAVKTRSLLDNCRNALLLVAGNYYTDDPICDQIMRNLRLDFSFFELIDILEVIGERDNHIVPVFIDAINETWNKSLWKNELSCIIAKIKETTMVKLVVTYRPEYEQSILSETVRENITKGDISLIRHNGLADNDFSGIKKFLDKYHIHFSPLEYFSYEMYNPLFLTLYCKTYNGDEVSLPALYDRLIEHANKKIYKSLEQTLSKSGYSEGDSFLKPLIYQIAGLIVETEKRYIEKSALLKLSYWTEYGLTPAVIINHLAKEDILCENISDGKEIYYFVYDQMNDYYCAKAILEKFNSEDDVRKYLSEVVLKIGDADYYRLNNADLFVNACALYAEKYKRECIDLIDELEDYEKEQFFSRYIDSFQWRDAKYLPVENFIELLNKYNCQPEDLWKMLIGNSVKVSSPFNADYLHHLLSSYELNRRDYLWTTHINRLTYDENERVIQLIEMYNRGESLDTTSEKQVELLLTLFGWLLTSSNRRLRDYTSKAMIEILKIHFHLCRSILAKFRDVNDPYVIQRLYGVVFGACCKTASNSHEDYRSLAEYVYNAVFNQEKVYPDILLRDYARLIIERFLYENPKYCGVIERQRIVPPYNSEPIPEIEDQHYLEQEYRGAMYRLISSMRFDGMGMYGDFGRYVFQGHLRSFEVDEKNIFNYAIYFIINELGFRGDLFDYHDSHCRGYDRTEVIKTERIGKKYQWIAMYNILARISDHNKMIDRWDDSPDGEKGFEGAWDPCVRDFDPTLNLSKAVCSDAPKFDFLDTCMTKWVTENKSSDVSTVEAANAWLETKGVFFKELKDTLLLTDENGTKWVSLTKYCDTGSKNLNREKLLVWSWLYAYFASPDQADALSQCAEDGLSVITSETASHHESHDVFNMEYPWSPSCRELTNNAFVDVKINTGEYSDEVQITQVPYIESVSEILKRYCAESSEIGEVYYIDDQIGFDDEPPFEITKDVGMILHATTDLVWGKGYDATMENAATLSVPCAQLIEGMNLHQNGCNGFYYDAEEQLAAFDAELTQNVNSVLVRKDVLDSFIEKTGMKLVWLVQAEKEIHASDYSIEQWSEWETVFIYEGERIDGDIHRMNQSKY